LEAKILNLYFSLRVSKADRSGRVAAESYTFGCGLGPHSPE